MMNIEFFNDSNKNPQCPYDTVLNIDTVNLETLDFNIFFQKYMSKNKPCIIKNVSTTWECTANWLKEGYINFDYIVQEYGKLTAPVANCDNIGNNLHCQNSNIMTVTDYMSYLKNPDKSQILYLKDWHLKRLRPHTKFYEVPYIFACDWLNEFALDKNEDDFMFVYIGPKNSWTPVHVDVYNSYSWSVNVTGIKKWTLFPPKEELKLQDSRGNMSLLFDKSKHTDVKYFEIIQQKGDAIFVPSGWHHQVINMADTISINHNFINACNLDMVTNLLLETLLKVEHEIEDLRNTSEFEIECQVILKADYRMDLPQYINFLCYIAEKRLKQLDGDTNVIFGSYTYSDNLIKFDLESILKNLQLIVKHPLLVNQSLKIYLQYDVHEIIKSILSTKDQS